MLYQYAKRVFLSEPVHGSVSERRSEIARRNKILGKYLKPKVTFAVSKGKLTEDEKRFVLNAHYFRNEAYHNGLTHDDIVFELAGTYYTLACRLLPWLAPSSITVSFDYSPSPIVLKYLGQGDLFTWADKQRHTRAAELLSNAQPQPQRTLAEALRSSLESRLKTIAEMLDYLSGCEPSGLALPNLLWDIQFRHDMWEVAPPEGFTLRQNAEGVVHVDPSQKKEYEKFRRFIQQQKWFPKVTLSTLDGWAHQAASLPTQKEPGRLLQKYHDLDAKIERFRKVVQSRCARLDQAIECEIERARFTPEPKEENA